MNARSSPRRATNQMPVTTQHNDPLKIAADSALLLGIVGFCGQIPTLLLAPLAGVYVDRWNRHRVLVITQALSLVQSAVLGILTLTGRVSVRR